MTPAIIISRYADTDINNRRRNVREGIALARWAAINGYCPIGWWDDLDTIDPPCDSDPAVRQAALERSATRARMVGAAGGILIMPGWYQQTQGMSADCEAFRAAGQGAEYGRWGLVKMVKFAEIEPYLPRDLVGQVQAAVEEILADRNAAIPRDEFAALSEAMDIIANHTGITPTEVTP